MGKLNEEHPLFVSVWKRFDSLFNSLRKDLIRDVEGNVLEIGAGTAENLCFYSKAGSVTLTEPDPFMREEAEKKSSLVKFPVKIVAAAAESLPFPDRSFDSLVTTFVLCSVEDPEAALSEMYRLVKPSGSLYFIEHVRSKNSFVAFLQDILTPIQKHLAAGCHLNRDTLDLISQAGFEITDLRRPYPWLPLYLGSCRPSTV